MKKLGVMIDSVHPNQCNLGLVQSLNHLSKELICDCCIFHNEYTPIRFPILVGMFQINEIYDFEGVVIATNIAHAKRLLNVPGPTKKYFYVWNLEWLKMTSFDYREIEDVYNSIELIARSERHSEVLAKCFKKPKMVFDNWKIDSLMTCVT